jgi:hypoxanthine-guanine phosphoribosyltransferase
VLKKEYINSKIENKKVLVIEDITSSGESLAKVMEYIAKIKPKKLYSTIVIGSVEDFPSFGLEAKRIHEYPRIYKLKDE